jgi:hypothetical protein
MRWDGSVTITDPALQPSRPTDLLTPFGTTATVELGIRLSDGTESVVPYGVYSVSKSQTTSSADNRVTQVGLIDLAQRIESYRFETPFTVTSGADLADVVNLVVADRIGVNPAVSATGRTIAADRVFGLSPETGPWTELLHVLDGFGLTAWYDRVGDIVIGNPIPDSQNVTDFTNVLDLAADFDVRPPNVIVVRGEAQDDTPPVQAVALDDDPASPTFAGTTVGGSPYGRVTYYFSSPLITSEAQAQQAAETILQRELGGGFAFDLSRPFDPTTDAGDGVGVGGTALAVDSVTVDLKGNTSMAVRTL